MTHEEYLEAAIEVAIDENDCPHTSDADIRYYMMEEHKAFMVDMLKRSKPDTSDPNYWSKTIFEWNWDDVVEEADHYSQPFK